MNFAPGQFGVLFVVLSFFLLFSSAAQAQTRSVDIKKGHKLAKRVCINCHIVDTSANTIVRGKGPSFRAMANTAGQTREGLAGKIIIPHPEMPTIALTRHEIRDIVTYIMSLKVGE